MNTTKVREKCCLTCEHFEQCPLIRLWAELNAPIVATSFNCLEYKEEMPDGKA